MSKNQKNKRREIRVPREIVDFTKYTFKKFKKDTRGYFKNKSKQRIGYYETMAENMMPCIEFFVRYGHIKDENIVIAKDVFCDFLKNEEFCERMIRMFDKGELDTKDYQLLPIIIRDILEEEAKKVRQALAENPDANVPTHDKLAKLSMTILKKKIKKFEKAGINRNLAFDLLSIIPHKRVLEFSKQYRVRMVYNTLYEHAKNMEIDFPLIMDKLFGDEYIPLVILFALLEKKEKFGELAESQKAFHTAITSWCIETMEHELSREGINQLLRSYVASRKRDESMNRDGNRRYPLSTLSEVDYPRLYKAINAYILNNEADKKYL